MKKVMSVLLALVMALAMLTACGANNGGEKKPADMKIGIVQLMEHPALDLACKGFVDTLVAAGFSADNIDIQNAQGEASNCAPIVNKFVNNNVDLILAIATPAAQTAAQTTKDIPILVTAVTDPVDAGLVASNEVPGGNVSGTSDMTPVDKQIAMLHKFVPDAETVGVLYCSSEANSKLQADMAVAEIEKLGLTSNVYTVSETSEINAVMTKITQECDALYIPTDNLFASNMSAVAQVAASAKLPVFAGDVNMVKEGGVATYGLDYENLGKLTGKQAIEILVNGADISTMPIGYSSEEDLSVYINEDMVAQIGITVPDEYKQA